mgnify:CR=1 FL=1
MTLTLFDRTAAITMTVSPDQAITLLGEMPAEIRARIRPDQPCRTFRTEGTEGTVLEAHPPGYFGLAVAQAYDTWGEDEAYQAYRRGEHADPRD